jgi:hypothetical protein
VAASTCLLTQIIQCVVRAAGERHPRFVEALRAVRAGHLRLLADLVAPGGTGVLVTDVVSSDSFPALASCDEGSLPAVLNRLVRAGNFFHGANPAALASSLLADPAVAQAVEAVGWAPPWLWDFGPRVYLVCALAFRKRAGAPGPRALSRQR